MSCHKLCVCICITSLNKLFFCRAESDTSKFKFIEDENEGKEASSQASTLDFPEPEEAGKEEAGEKEKPSQEKSKKKSKAKKGATPGKVGKKKASVKKGNSLQHHNIPASIPGGGSVVINISTQPGGQ